MEQIINAEYTLLADIMLNNDGIIETIGILTERDFENKRAGEIFKAMRALFNRGVGIDTTTLNNELGGNLKGSELIAIGNASERPESIADHARIVKANSDKRTVKQTLIDALRRIDQDDPQEVITQINESFIKTATKGGARNIVELADETYLRIQERVRNGGKLPGISSGYKILDKATGGFRRGEYTVIAARPSMGKTAFLLNVIRQIDVKERVLFFSMEMNSETVMDRLTANEAGLSLTAVNHGHMTERQLNNDIGDGIVRLASRGNIFIDDTRGLTIEQIRARIKKEKAQNNISVVCIDHLGKIRATSKKSKYETVGEISGALSDLAGEMDVALIVLSQLNRASVASADKIPDLSHLRDSGNIEEDADRVILLHREDYYEHGGQTESELQAIIAKNRNGGRGIIKFDYDLLTQRITER